MAKALKFGVYTEMNAMPGVDSADSVRDVMRHIEQCDALGLDVFMVIEHYFFPTFGQSSNPLALFSRPPSGPGTSASERCATPCRCTNPPCWRRRSRPRTC